MLTLRTPPLPPLTTRARLRFPSRLLLGHAAGASMLRLSRFSHYAVSAAMPRLVLLLLLCLFASVRGLNLNGLTISDPASGAACYTNSSACGAAAANAGLCGNGPSSQPCVSGTRSYCAFSGSNIWYCPNAGAPPAGVSYSVDSLTGTPCHASSASCGSLASNTCSAAQCLNGALSACAFTASGVYVWCVSPAPPFDSLLALR